MFGASPITGAEYFVTVFAGPAAKQPTVSDNAAAILHGCGGARRFVVVPNLETRADPGGSETVDFQVARLTSR